MSILDKDSMTEDHWSNNPRFKKTSMTTEDEEFNRIEREATMRKEAVRATVTVRGWVDLTDDEKDEIWGNCLGIWDALEDTQKKLREKNT